MRVVVATETRFDRTPDGKVWTLGGPGYGFWKRYTVAFDNVRVVARVADVPARPEGAVRVDGDDVHLWPIPYYIGPRQYARRRGLIIESTVSSIEYDDAVILRVPSPIGTILAGYCDRVDRPYALEVVGDPAEALSRGAVRHPLRPLVQSWATLRLRQQCSKAKNVTYVTRNALQSQYPATGGRSWHYSDVNLMPEAFVERPRHYPKVLALPRLVSVGSLEQLYKGIDILLEAMAILRTRGVGVSLTHVGDGFYLPQMRDLANRLDIAQYVNFVGAVPGGEGVRQHLDQADLFVHPSRTEGLPRALLEAMARGLPAIASSVGGIPELLPEANLVPPNNPEVLAGAIQSALAAPASLTASSRLNHAEALNFKESLMAERYTDFYTAVRDTNRDWCLASER